VYSNIYEILLPALRFEKNRENQDTKNETNDIKERNNDFQIRRQRDKRQEVKQTTTKKYPTPTRQEA
jgi:hypothetical protein